MKAFFLSNKVSTIVFAGPPAVELRELYEFNKARKCNQQYSITGDELSILIVCRCHTK
jgi:hypothetical protein